MRKRKEKLADNRITTRLTDPNLENFLNLAEKIWNMSATMNMILTNYFEKNGKLTKSN